MIKISLNCEQIEELKQFRIHASSKDSEKALMVLLNSEGKKISEISKVLKRNAHTVRDWLKRYRDYGLEGLSRRYSPGRPDIKRSTLKGHIETILSNSPVAYGYADNTWTVPLIAHDATVKLGMDISTDTVVRALKSMGYSYKRPSKTVPARAPSKEEKKEKIEAIIKEIQSLLSKSKSEVEIYALDESHFSTEPYLVRGWFKKRWPPQNREQQQTRKSHFLWVLESRLSKILLEKIEII